MGRALWGEGVTVSVSLNSPAELHKIVNPTGLVEGLALANGLETIQLLVGNVPPCHSSLALTLGTLQRAFPTGFWDRYPPNR